MTDPHEIAKGLTKAQRRDLALIAAALAHPSTYVAAHDAGARGIVCDALWCRGLLNRQSDPRKWGRSVYSLTDAGQRVFEALRGMEG